MTDKKQTPMDPDIPLEPAFGTIQIWGGSPVCFEPMKGQGVCLEPYHHPGPHKPTDRRQEERRQK